MNVVRLFFVAVILCLAILASRVYAHHAAQGVDESRIVEIDGTVVGTRWVNPHVVFWVSVGEGVDRQRWLVEAPDRDSLVHDGWKQPMVGDKILFYVHPHIDPTVRQSSDDVPAWYVGAVLSDGTQFGATPDFWRKRQERRVEQFVD